MSDFLASFSHVHCIGLGGIGVSAVAKFCKVQGKSVSGSDSHASVITEACAAMGINFSVGHDAANIPEDCDLVVYSEAVPENNAERVAATERGIRQLGHFGFLGELSKSYRTICVTGTHGKSTTTAMLGKIFEAAGYDPTVFVGSLVPGFSLGNVRVGQGPFLVVEGDEYKRKMLQLHPEVTLITNIEHDHPDVYRDLADVQAAFDQLAAQTSGPVISGNDLNGLNPEDRMFGEGTQTLGDITLSIPGIFNMKNAYGAKKVAAHYGVPDEIICRTLRDFSGIWRRFERVGAYRGAPVISDYAHHPTAVKATIVAARELFPNRRIVLAFEPHQHARTRELFSDFVEAFDGADLCILSEIYGVEGRTESAGAISSQDLVDAIAQRNTAPGALFYAPDLAHVRDLLERLVKSDDVVIVMGAGNIDSVARALVV